MGLLAAGGVDGAVALLVDGGSHVAELLVAPKLQTVGQINNGFIGRNCHFCSNFALSSTEF